MNRTLTESAVREILIAAGWTPATCGGVPCAIDAWTDAGDFSTEAGAAVADGSCAWVLLLCRTEDCVPTLVEMAHALAVAGFGTRSDEDGMEFLRILPRPVRGRKR